MNDHAVRAVNRAVKSFGLADLADAAILAFARAAAGRPLADADRNALRRVERFLEDAKRGYEWLNHPEVTSESKCHASSFDTAARTWGHGSPLAFLQDLEKMTDTVRAILDGKPVESTQVDTERKFFRQVLFSAVDDIAEHEPSVRMPPLEFALTSS